MKNRHKKLTIYVWILTAYYRARMLLIPSKYQEKTWGIKNEESADEVPNEYFWTIRCISQVVNRVADKTPWESKCMVRAFAAQHLLTRKGISSTLYLGVGKDDQGEMIAHAWIRSGKIYVTGGDGHTFAVVAKYRK